MYAREGDGGDDSPSPWFEVGAMHAWFHAGLPTRLVARGRRPLLQVWDSAGNKHLLRARDPDECAMWVHHISEETHYGVARPARLPALCALSTSPCCHPILHHILRDVCLPAKKTFHHWRLVQPCPPHGAQEQPSRPPAPPAARFGHTCVAYGDQLLLFGGRPLVPHEEVCPEAFHHSGCILVRLAGAFVLLRWQ